MGGAGYVPSYIARAFGTSLSPLSKCGNHNALRAAHNSSGCLFILAKKKLIFINRVGTTLRAVRNYYFYFISKKLNILRRLCHKLKLRAKLKW